MIKYLLFTVFSLVLIIASCKKSDDTNIDLPQASKIYYISNEGAFGFGNASLSVFYPDSNTIINHAFEAVNGRKLGDVMQSVSVVNDKIYMILNSSNKVEIADAKTLVGIGTVSNLPLPRYMVARTNSKAYVSCWGATGIISVLDLNTNSVIKSLPAGSGPEKMLLASDRLMVCNSGGFAKDSVIQVFDAISDTFLMSVFVGHNPTDIVQIDNSTAWVLCSGYVDYNSQGQIVSETQASLVEFDFITGQLLFNQYLASGLHPTHIEISPDKNTIYFGGGYGFSGIYSFEISSHNLSSQPLINETFYGFNVDPASGDIYGFLAPSFTAAGQLKIYKSGLLFKTFSTGIGPNQITF